MLALFLAILAAAWLVGAVNDRSSYHVHGSVMFIRTGERTPLVEQNDDQLLSALGAQQMHTLGQHVRGRYLDGNNALTGMGQQSIADLAPDTLNNKQVLVQTLDTPYLMAAAQAFMQGLYPPHSINTTRNGPFADATGILSNGSAIDFPLGGYQYPRIQAYGHLDPNYVFLAGNQECPLSNQASLMYETTNAFLQTRQEARDFYQALDPGMFNGHFQQDELDYINAFSIYDYLSYQYTHNSSVLKTFGNDSTFSGVYDRLRWYADQQSWYYWGNTSASTSDDDNQAIAGKTLAALVLGSFQKIVEANGNKTDGKSHPLTLLFGEHEPFVSLFSLMEVDNLNADFRAVPPFGSTLFFELFSRGSSADFPTDSSDLWVNFYFQNGTTDYDGQPQAYALFNRGPDGTDMSWFDFEDMMSRIMMSTLQDWCTQCSASALFCSGIQNAGIDIVLDGQRKRSPLTPTVAGVVGAVVTLAVAGLVFALAMLVGGLRFHRVARSKKSGLGGFKGSAKLASDADLSLPKHVAPSAGIVSVAGGAAAARQTPHERVGSWELRQKELGPQTPGSEVSPRGSFEAIEAAMSRPVEPVERV